MGRKGSLNYQLHQKMEKINCIGQSRHLAKIEARAMGRNSVIGIHGEETYNNYRSVSKILARYLKEQGHNDLDKVTRQDLKGFLADRRDNHDVKPVTLNKDLAAINKIFSTDITKKEANLPETSYKDATRARQGQTGKFNPKDWKDQIDTAKAVGCRRESIHSEKNIGWKHFPLTEKSFFQKDGKVWARLIEKGGKYREAPVLAAHQERVKAIFREKTGKNIPRGGRLSKNEFKEIYRQGLKEGKTMFFNRYTTEINNQEYRRNYAAERYHEHLKELGINEKRNFRGYDSRVLEQISKDLGHGRLDIVVESYLPFR